MVDRAMSRASQTWANVLDGFQSNGGFGDPLRGVGGPGYGFGNPLSGMGGGGLAFGNPLNSLGGGYGFGDPLAGVSGAGFGFADPLSGIGGGGYAATENPFNRYQFDPNGMQQLTQLALERAAAEASNNPSGQAPPGSAGAGRGLQGTYQWQDMINKAAQEAGIPPEVIQAIMGIESGGNPGSISVAGARGLMQIMPEYWQGTANQFGGDLMDPWVNIRTGAEILKTLYNQYGNWDSVAAAYLGAVDANGNPTSAPDAYGTTGYQYVDLFNQNLYALQGGGGAGVQAPGGQRVFPVKGYQGDLTLHHGSHPGAIDIFAPYGTPVLAMTGGTAVSGYSDIGGYWTLITGDDGLQYYYAHMDKMGPNGRVEAGSYIAGVSDTGNAQGTGAHLHLGIGTDIYEGTGPAGGAGDANVISILQNAYRY